MPGASLFFSESSSASALAGLQLLLVLVALPYCLYRAPGWPFFAALVLAYVNALLMLVLIAWRFGRAGISRWPLLALGFGWLACLPLSVNALRKAGLSFDIAVDARRAIRLISFDEKSRARADLDAQIAEAMQELEEDDTRYGRLAALRQKLTPEAAPGRL